MAIGYFDGYPLFDFATNYCYGYWCGYWLLLMVINYYYGYYFFGYWLF